MDTPDQTDREKKDTVSAELRGETMAYAVQSGIFNLGANFFEPYINYKAQQYYTGHYDKTHPGAYGNYTQNLAGEFAGDIIGASSLILAEAFIPTQLHTFTRKARGWVDPLYTSVAHALFQSEKSSPDYEQKVEKWKTFQERNLVRSAIMAAAGIAGNVVTQKTVIKNPSPTTVIFAGKLLSRSLTTALGLGIRMAFPQQTKNLDKWMGKNIFAPMMEDKEIIADDSAKSHVDDLRERSDEKSKEPVR